MLHRADGGADKVARKLAGVVDANIQTGLYARADDEDRKIGQQLDGGAQHRGQPRHNRGEGRAFEALRRAVVEGEQVGKQHRILGFGAQRIGFDPRGEEKPVFAVHPENDVGVADVDGQDHEPRPPSKALEIPFIIPFRPLSVKNPGEKRESEKTAGFARRGWHAPLFCGIMSGKRT